MLNPRDVKTLHDVQQIIEECEFRRHITDWELDRYFEII